MYLTGRREIAVQTPTGGNKSTFITVSVFLDLIDFFCSDFLKSALCRDGDSFQRNRELEKGLIRSRAQCKYSKALLLSEFSNGHHLSA